MDKHSIVVNFSASGNGPLLEGVLHLPDGSGPFPAAVVCHPHPMMGGTMDNTVIVAVCHTLATHGWIALRFKFRGAGRSKGSFDDGRGEMDDVAGAVDFLCVRPEVDADRLAFVGYSFGAGVGLHYAVRDYRMQRLTGIALVQENYADPFLDADQRHKLFIVGEHDPWAPPDALREYVTRLNPPKTLYIIPGTDHFFGGREAEVATLIANFLADSQ